MIDESKDAPGRPPDPNERPDKDDAAGRGDSRLDGRERSPGHRLQGTTRPRLHAGPRAPPQARAGPSRAKLTGGVPAKTIADDCANEASGLGRITDIQGSPMSYSQMTLLPDRGLVEIRGPDAAAFLQDLVTNDVEASRRGEAMFAGSADAAGQDPLRFSDPYARSARPIGWIARGIRRTPSSSASPCTSCAPRWRSPTARRNLPSARPGATSARERRCGARRLCRSALCAARRAVSSSPPAQARASSRRRMRPITATAIALAVPQGGLDYAYGEAFPHEACYDELHGVDFDKGCYVGQEVVSRMHHRGTAKTRIAADRGQRAARCASAPKSAPASSRSARSARWTARAASRCSASTGSRKRRATAFPCASATSSSPRRTPLWADQLHRAVRSSVRAVTVDPLRLGERGPHLHRLSR